MTAAMIVQLILALGPAALDLIPRLTAIWSKPALTVDEVIALCAPARKSYDEYAAEARARLAAAAAPGAVPPVPCVPVVA